MLFFPWRIRVERRGRSAFAHRISKRVKHFITQISFFLPLMFINMSRFIAIMFAIDSVRNYEATVLPGLRVCLSRSPPPLGFLVYDARCDFFTRKVPFLLLFFSSSFPLLLLCQARNKKEGVSKRKAQNYSKLLLFIDWHRG